VKSAVLATLSVLLLCAACDGTAGPDAAVDSSTPDDATADAPPDTRTDALGWDAGSTPVDTRIVTAGPLTARSGQERTDCMSFDLGNESPAMIRAIRTHLSAGSHHMIVYRLDEPPDATPTACGAFSHGVAASLFIAQQAEASMVYPDGAGLPVDAHQTIGIEMHYINYFADDLIDITGTVELDLVEPDPDAGEVELLFTGDLSLTIPARGTATETSIHFPPAGTRLFALTSHTHQLGRLATIHRGFSTTAPGELLHRSTTWSEPPLDVFDPPLTFADREGMILTCEFENTTDRTVGFGTDFDDEMCFLWAYLVR